MANYETLTSTLGELQGMGLYTGVGDVYIAFLTAESDAATKPTYTTPILAAEAVTVGLTPQYAEGSQSASDRTIRKVRRLTGMQVRLEYPRIKAAVRAALLAMQTDANGGQSVLTTMQPEVAIGVMANRDDGTKHMRWIYKGRSSETEVSMATAEEGSITYQIPVIQIDAVPLIYETAGPDGKKYPLVQYEADTADKACKWTPENFFADVAGPWSAAVGA